MRLGAGVRDLESINHCSQHQLHRPLFAVECNIPTRTCTIKTKAFVRAWSMKLQYGTFEIRLWHVIICAIIYT